LYCPACGAEYPLTFSLCPVHGVQLTRQSMQCVATQSASQSAEPQIDSDSVVLNQPHIDRKLPVTANEATSNHHPNVDTGNGVATNSANLAGAKIIEHGHRDSGISASDAPANGTQHPPMFLSESQEPEPHGFRVAAIATKIALAIFALVGLYALISNLSRRPSPGTRPASQIEAAQAVPFVVTPREALDYKEEQPAAPAAEKLAGPPATTRIVERERKEMVSSSNEERDRKSTVARSIPRLRAGEQNLLGLSLRSDIQYARATRSLGSMAESVDYNAIRQRNQSHTGHTIRTPFRRDGRPDIYD